MRLSRKWAMPSHETFTIPPIAAFVERYLQEATISIDPFARDFTRATYTNDLNPDTLAEYHMDALEFLQLLKDQSVRADLVIFDPPYSLRQVKECYGGIGRSFSKEDAQLAGHWAPLKNIANDLLKIGGAFLHFGWHTNGMGKIRAYKIEEILLVSHGRCHNDTICSAERKHQEQRRLETP